MEFTLYEIDNAPDKSQDLLKEAEEQMGMKTLSNYTNHLAKNAG